MAWLNLGGAVEFVRVRLGEAFGPVFFGFAALAGLSAAACYVLLGAEAFAEAVARDRDLMLAILPRMLAAVAVAGFVGVLLPRERIAALLGGNSGLRGLVIAALAGMVTPGGPMAAFSFVVVLRGAGSDKGALVAYLTGWSVLGMQRILVWDVPFMGADFSVLRFLVSFPLPILAGWIARQIPIAPFPPSAPDSAHEPTEPGR